MIHGSIDSIEGGINVMNCESTVTMLIEPCKDQDSLRRKLDFLLTDIRILIQHVQNHN